MQKLWNMLETRKISALAVVTLFLILSLTGQLETNFIQSVIISVISFYFGQSTARDNPKKPPE